MDPGDSVDTLRLKVAALLEASFLHVVMRDSFYWFDIAQKLADSIKTGDVVSREDFVSLLGTLLREGQETEELLCLLRRIVLLDRNH